MKREISRENIKSLLQSEISIILSDFPQANSVSIIIIDCQGLSKPIPIDKSRSSLQPTNATFNFLFLWQSTFCFCDNQLFVFVTINFLFLWQSTFCFCDIQLFVFVTINFLILWHSTFCFCDNQLFVRHIQTRHRCPSNHVMIQFHFT
jgi:hypothetical protein